MLRGSGIRADRTPYSYGGATLALNFTANSLNSSITLTRGGATATIFDSTGTLMTMAANQPRFDYNPSTLQSLGLLIEELRTNGIRNNTMVGASTGTPGTPPTNWFMSTAGGNLTSVTIVAIGTDSGISYIDVRFVTSGLFDCDVLFETLMAASQGQTWTSSMYVKLQAGSMTNISSCQTVLAEYNSVPTFLGAAGTSNFTPTGSALSGQRYSYTYTTTNAGTTRLYTTFRVKATGASDSTWRIGMPHTELGAFATSVIPTSSAAVTRNADIATITTLTPWYNSAEGTLFCEYAVKADSGTSISPGGMAFSDGTTNNYMTIYSRTIDDTNLGSVVTATVSQASLTIGSITYGTPVKAALVYKANDFAYCSGGLTVQTDAAGTVPTVSQLDVGNFGNANFLNGYVKRIAYYSRRMTNGEVQALTQ